MCIEILTTKDVAQILNVNVRTIINYIHKGLINPINNTDARENTEKYYFSSEYINKFQKPTKFERFSKKEQTFIINNYASFGPKQLGNILNVKRHIIDKFARKHKLFVKSEVKGKNISESKKGSCRKLGELEKFEKIIDEQTAYFLGIFWADGHLHKNNRDLVLSISKEDGENIKNIINKHGKFKTYICQPPGGRKPQMVFKLSDRRIHSLLNEYNYKTKSFESADKILNDIPEHLRSYWFRGLFDGDGCFYINEQKKRMGISIASGYNQNWTYLINLCHKLKINFAIVQRSYPHKNSKSSVFCIYKRLDILIFLKYIYNGYESDFIGFKRKYNKFVQLKNYLNQRKWFQKILKTNLFTI